MPLIKPLSLRKTKEGGEGNKRTRASNRRLKNLDDHMQYCKMRYTKDEPELHAHLVSRQIGKYATLNKN
eukprot:8425595-Pyramimonas_sp.AAC.1